MLRLGEGAALIPVEDRQRHHAFFLSQQNADGGFHGRSETSDLYYTAFALRGLVLTGEINSAVAERLAGYLRQQLQGNTSLIDLISLVFAARLLESSTGLVVLDSADSTWARNIAEMFETLRRKDGGYAKTFEGQASSTYQTFLIALAYQLMELQLPEPEKACQFILSQQRDDGGFVEIRVMRRSGTNPTAAAIGTLRVLGQQLLTEDLKDSVADFLLDSVTDEGGFRANTQIPIADLLSTFTALQTIVDVDAVASIEKRSCLEFVKSLQAQAGGFLAAAWDEAVDVEYSFYGIASYCLLTRCFDSQPDAG